MGNETPGLNTPQPKKRREEENQGIECWSLFCEGRLMIPYNGREENPRLLR